MRRGIACLCLGLVLGFAFCYLILNFISTPSIEPVFSPDGGNKIISLIDSAQSSIDIEMYVFTSRDVVEALWRAKSRGVKTRIIIERNTMGGENSAIHNELAAKGFNIRYASTQYKLTHAKIMIIDGKFVLVGSHNFSNSALYENREASVIISDDIIIRQFLDVFETDWQIAN